MLAYRITIDSNELKYYHNNKIYYDNKPIFNTTKNSLYEINTFPNKDGIYKYFYYYPIDAYEIAKIVLKLNHNIDNVYILEYILDNNEIINKVGFGNYRRLVRKDYVPIHKQYKIYPYLYSTYPVLEIRMNPNNIIIPSGNIYSIDRNTLIPTKLNKQNKLREYILYKIYLEKVLVDFNINYPHDEDGLMIITKHEGNVKKLTIPKKYQSLIC